MSRPRVVCPICGDRRPFVLWIDPDPPTECPEGPHVRSVTDCQFQMADAKRAAEWRRACPEAFDAAGNILPGGLVMVMTKLHGGPQP